MLHHFVQKHTYKKHFCVPIMHLQLYFLGSASGFYFVYDFCLYDKMSSEMAYFLRYIPLFVSVLTYTVVLITKRVFKNMNVPSSIYK